MARSLNSRCDFENGFFTCDLSEDAMLKSGLKSLEIWKKTTKDGKTSPRKLPGVLTPRSNDH